MSSVVDQTRFELGFYEALVACDESSCHQLLGKYYDEHSTSVRRLCDALTRAFHRIGRAWECSELEVYREHQASQIGYGLLLDLRSRMLDQETDRPLAIGCTPEGDPYRLATTMVEIILRKEGWRADSLGTGLPLEFVVPAIEQHRPDLCWVSVSHVESSSRLLEQFAALRTAARRYGTTVICGGRAVPVQLRSGDDVISYLPDLGALQDFVRDTGDFSRLPFRKSESDCGNC